MSQAFFTENYGESPVLAGAYKPNFGQLKAAQYGPTFGPLPFSSFSLWVWKRAAAALIWHLLVIYKQSRLEVHTDGSMVCILGQCFDYDLLPDERSLRIYIRQPPCIISYPYPKKA